MSFQKYDENGQVIRNRIMLDCQQAIKDGEIVRVEQSHKDEVNINNIVKRHGADLIAKTASLVQLRYDDVTTNDFQETMQLIVKGNETFMSLPHEVREEFRNDPARYMDYIRNPENKQDLIDRGWMIGPEPEEPPVQVVITNPEETPLAPNESEA